MGKSPADDQYRKSPTGRRAKKAQNQRYRDSPAGQAAISKAAKKYAKTVKRISCSYTDKTGLEDFYAFIELAAKQKCSTAELNRKAIAVYIDYINNRRLV